MSNTNTFTVGQKVAHQGRRGTITAVTAWADTGEQLTIIVRFAVGLSCAWHSRAGKSYEFKVDDRWLEALS